MAGPPLAAAVPIVEKIPAPIMAAIPKAVRSRTPRLLFSEKFRPPSAPDSGIRSLNDFFLNKLSFRMKDPFVYFPGRKVKNMVY